MGVDALITGVCGMLGSHLAEKLQASGLEVVGTYYRPTIDLRELPERLQKLEMDLRYPSQVAAVIGKYKPKTLYHLGAQSYPTVSWDRPQETMDTNVNGTVNVFEGVKAARAADKGYEPAVVSACSSAEYGASLLLSPDPIKEGAELLPLHPYGVSKVATDLLSYQYFKSDGIRSLRARIFNTSGPRKQGDVISDFGRRIAAMPPEGGKLRVGNLSTRRAFLHVDDTSEALIALGERGVAGEAYNICGVEVVSIGDLLPMFERSSGRKITPDVDPSLLRPTDEPIIWGDISKIGRDAGWRPRRTVSDIVEDVFRYEAKRAAVASGGMFGVVRA